MFSAKIVKLQAHSDVDLERLRPIVFHLPLPSMFDAVS